LPIRVSTDSGPERYWSKLDTEWEGVSVDTLLEGVETTAEFVVAYCDGGYTTNLPLADVTGCKAWIAFGYGGEPLAPEHGGPARLLVPHLYFWKSAKWVRELRLLQEDEPGFWEGYGYHDDQRGGVSAAASSSCRRGIAGSPRVCPPSACRCGKRAR
jgi:DMSO/TMAO reductase YedYZ molybdopterin-dependent catalytic subunit